ncbi:ribosomal silencing factor RsfS [Halolactibacillus alkaliphilus]|uniref:Ribosomal silencing factor RsfS n=1 Tax=Halolactibacillus alkaliphilus TaxID=442899 RepID=A0A511WZF5_9BACI|nr:ribosome silencing factor [Halolactibacillus alkaliphilus]GEN56068.1 ribosomal silencing factor RsfS [Halolactibacillus alkaliphilus]GGN67862.1 ribosomal silencing factor RsfS [Halolactibacillus alkaliphilus]SFO70359.1 ribosome-associated protein [Halolactibacillus alkaliphilus]
MTSKELLELAAKAADEKRGYDIIGLDVRELTSVADYYLICDASNERQVQAIAREIKDQAEKAGIEVKKLEGFDKARWILVDIGDVVCHVFHKEERNYYNLERLWGDAPVLALSSNDEA